MFYIGIPLKPRFKANNWNQVLNYLNNTLRSIYNSTNQNYHVFITTDTPDEVNKLVNDKTTVLYAESQEHKTNNFIQESTMDKSEKKRIIGSYIKSFHTESFYFMFMDADDLIHKNLIDYVLKDDNKNGYVVDTGYVLDIKHKLLAFKENVDKVCGSCFIGYFEPDDLPYNKYDTQSVFSQFKNHKYYVENAKSNGKYPESIPYPYVVYYKNHGDSLEANRKKPLRIQIISKLHRGFLSFKSMFGYDAKLILAHQMLQNKYALPYKPKLDVVVLYP